MNASRKILTALAGALLLTGLAACEKKTEVTLTVGDSMAFDKTSFEAAPGSTVTLTLKHTGTSPAMQHNVIVTKPGTDAEVSTAGMAAGPDKNYVPENPNIIASTKLVKPGESVTVTFKAPDQPGEYPYLCSFPGHYPLMKGVMSVK